jgi:outer membrane protein
LLILAAGPAAAELKIAVLDTQRALVASEEAQALLQQAQQELQAEEEAVKSLGEEIIANQEKLQTDGEVMSPTEQRRLQKDIEDKQIDYQFLVNKLQKQVNDRRQELLAQMVPKIDAVLKDLIELEGYDLIMERGNLRYVNTKHDITRKVTEKLNEKR